MPNPSSPLVSIVTPVLNCASTVELTLASVAAQTYPNIEHIVVDGESTDGTIDILRGFRSVVPLRWLSEPDTGMYAAINKGIGLARGEIIAYLNGDDLYLPWSVERAVSALMSSGDDLVFGDIMLLQKRGGLGRSATIQFYPRFRPRIYAYEVNVAQPSVFWRRRVSDRVGGFDERLRYCGDFEYWLRTGTAGFRYTHVREVLAIEVDHEGTLSMIHSDELRREIDRTRARYAEIVRPRRFLRLRALTHLTYWRWQVLMLRLNLRRSHPSSWTNFIRFLKRADVKLSGSSIIPLLLPLPLPRSWSMWELDAAEFELKLIAEFRSRCSGA
jgi:glycosyltransferase involved in cell wall biosynthesis